MKDWEQDWMNASGRDILKSLDDEMTKEEYDYYMSLPDKNE